MLEELVKLRRGELETRSIIFIAHGYGGIVVKEAISTAAISRIYGNGAHTGVATIYAHLIGIMFLGTVHLAIPGQSIGQTLAEVSRLNPRHENSTLSSFMEAQSDFFEKVVTDFNLFTRDVQIVCILEDRPTPSGQVRINLLKSTLYNQLICSSSADGLQGGGHARRGTQRDHRHHQGGSFRHRQIFSSK